MVNDSTYSIKYIFYFKPPQEKAPHPLDVQYGLLSCDLELVDKKSKEFKVSGH